jgi:catechol 2,3-dioxygenase-like lactoylglutathione lyase family enzyme
MKLSQTIPALPVASVTKAVEFYRDRMGFLVQHRDDGFAVVARDDAVLHLWEAGDETWLQRKSWERPIRSGAETFIAGTASCRIQVLGRDGVDALFAELQQQRVLHTVSEGGPVDTDFGSREFSTLDSEGNLLTFFTWRERASDG